MRVRTERLIESPGCAMGGRSFYPSAVTNCRDYTILCNKYRGPTIFDDMHRPTILGSNEVPKTTCCIFVSCLLPFLYLYNGSFLECRYFNVFFS